MREYTVLALCSAIAVLTLDMLILKTRHIITKQFGVYLLVMYVFNMLVNGYLTWRPIVTYGEAFKTNLHVFTIPAEDFVFGFSLVAMSVVMWEFLSRKYPREQENSAIQQKQRRWRGV